MFIKWIDVWQVECEVCTGSRLIAPYCAASSMGNPKTIKPKKVWMDIDMIGVGQALDQWITFLEVKEVVCQYFLVFVKA